jgi:two-component system, chemotaxis family, chemotaxis protein CheY
MEYAKQLRVLVVEPSNYLNSIIRDALENGLSVPPVTLCRSGKDGQGILAETRVNLLLVKVDADCPDGMPLIASIRAGQTRAEQDLPIIGMTAAPTRLIVEQLRDLGVNEILALPLSAKALAERIQSVFEHPRDWIVSATYVGPDRRRKKGVQYQGGERRDGDEEDDLEPDDRAASLAKPAQ